MKVPSVILLVLSCLAFSPALQAQEYTQPPVKVSKEKVRSGGKVYYSHIVQEKQTLYSIARAYGVTVDEICRANPDYRLKEEGLKKSQILLIPVSSAAPVQDAPVRAEADTGNAGSDVDGQAGAVSSTDGTEAAEASPTVGEADSPQDGKDYFIHTVRWYEDLGDIARKYGVSTESIRLLNNLKGNKIKNRQKLKIPRVQAAAESSSDASSDIAAETSGTEGGGEEDSRDSVLDNLKNIFTPVKTKNPVEVSLLLPLTSGGRPSHKGMDFYSGFLMAVRDLGEEGIGTRLNVHDTGAGMYPSQDEVRASDMVVGPVNASDIRKVLETYAGSTPVISPLDPKAGVLASQYDNFIQAPASADVQYEDLVKWIRSDLGHGDRVMVISEKDGKSAGIVNTVNELLAENGVPYSSISYNILEGRDIVNTMEASLGEGTVRAVIASDNEAFVNDVVRNLGLLVYKKHDVVLYSAARIRSFNTIEIETLHVLNTHVSMSYYIDYSSPRTQKFISGYRALFGAEPTQFSFQGYDIAYFFIRNCHDGGTEWLRHLSSADGVSLMQADFLFAEEYDGKGFVNQGIRRAVYRPDYSIGFVR